MYSSKYSVSIHILSVIAVSDKQVTSEYLASSINTNPSLVRRLMSELKKAGLIKTKTKLGITGLAKRPEEISLLEVFRAVEKKDKLFAIHEETNLNCPIGARIVEVLENVNQEIQTDFEKKLESLTMNDILQDLNSKLNIHIEDSK